MQATIGKWGSSYAVRLPKAVMAEAGLQQDDRVEIVVKDGSVLIIPARRHTALQDRAAGYSAGYHPSEWATGQAVGREIV